MTVALRRDCRVLSLFYSVLLLKSIDSEKWVERRDLVIIQSEWHILEAIYRCNFRTRGMYFEVCNGTYKL